MPRVTKFHEDPHCVARGFQKMLDQPDIGPVTVENGPLLSQRIPPLQMRPALKLGEHTCEAMTRLLRMTDSEVSALIAQGVPEESETHVH
jgi:crotonobetainyl-CoA:carnitine CoA-transferase CaiB-like acyl-CoA transferase